MEVVPIPPAPNENSAPVVAGVLLTVRGGTGGSRGYQYPSEQVGREDELLVWGRESHDDRPEDRERCHVQGEHLGVLDLFPGVDATDPNDLFDLRYVVGVRRLVAEAGGVTLAACFELECDRHDERPEV